MKNEQKWVAVLAASCLSPAALRAEVPVYTVIELGRLPSSYRCDCTAMGMNSQGQVVGYCDVDYVARAVVWTHGIPQDIGPGVARSIDDSGRVLVTDFDGYTTFLWDAVGGMRPLELPPYVSVRAQEMNGAGQICGVVLDAENHFSAFRLDGDALTILMPPGAAGSDAGAVNARGHVLGSWYDGAGNGGRFLYQDGTFVEVPDCPGGWYSTYLMDVNDSDAMVGWVLNWDAEPFYRVVSYDSTSGQYTILPLPAPYLHSDARLIGEQGQIVGKLWWADTTRYFDDMVLWLPDGVIYSLNELVPPGWDIQRADFISVTGVIGGTGDLNGVRRAYLLVPGRCPGDVVGDGLIDLGDLAGLLAAFGSCDGEANFQPLADLNADGCVGLDDLGEILAIFGTSCL